MKIVMVKGSNAPKKFKIFETFGAEVLKLENLEETDKKLKELIKNEYTTIVVTNEVASFSESIVKEYRRREDIKIIITPN